jgi:hypothetical protein
MHDDIHGILQFLFHCIQLLEKAVLFAGYKIFSNAAGLVDAAQETHSAELISNSVRPNILGYYIDINDKKLDRFIEVISADKTESTRLNFEKARNDNIFSYEWERVLELNTSQTRIGGSCVVKAMSIDGYEVPGMGLRDMYHQCFWYENNDYIWKATYSGYDAIDLIKSIGGIPVIAHPKSVNDDNIVLDLIQHGAQGLEVYHPMHSNEDSSKYLQMAIDKRLYISGGSDWHGKNSYEGSTFPLTGLTHENYGLLKLRNPTV